MFRMRIVRVTAEMCERRVSMRWCERERSVVRERERWLPLSDELSMVAAMRFRCRLGRLYSRLWIAINYRPLSMFVVLGNGIILPNLFMAETDDFRLNCLWLECRR